MTDEHTADRGTSLRLETSGYSSVRRQPSKKDSRYTAVWVSNDGHSWHLLGVEGPPADGSPRLFDDGLGVIPDPDRPGEVIDTTIKLPPFGYPAPIDEGAH